MPAVRFYALAVCAAAALSRPAALRADAQALIHLQFERSSRVPAAVRNDAVREASRVWAPYDILIDEAACSSAAIAIVFDVDHGRRAAPDDLGEIRFDARGVPQRLITLYYRPLEKLATSVEVRGAASRYWPLLLREEALGRSVGRALAHEIGHYLLRWAHHDPTGLMRAAHHASALVDPDPRPFMLTDTDLLRLHIVRTALPTFADAGAVAAADGPAAPACSAAAQR